MRSYPNQPDESIFDLQAALAQQRNDAEDELVGCVLSDPKRGIERAAAAGLRGHHFQDESLLCIYLSVIALRTLRRLTGDIERDLLKVCLLAREGLRRGGWWEAGVFGWNDERLAFLADTWPGVSQVPVLARRVVELHHRAVEADQAYRRCLELLEYRAEPVAMRRKEVAA